MSSDRLAVRTTHSCDNISLHQEDLRPPSSVIYSYPNCTSQPQAHHNEVTSDGYAIAWPGQQVPDSRGNVRATMENCGRGPMDSAL